MPSASYPQPDPAQAAEAPNHMALRLAGVTPRRRGRSCRERPRGLLRGLSDDGLQRDGSGRGGGWRLADQFADLTADRAEQLLGRVYPTGAEASTRHQPPPTSSPMSATWTGGSPRSRRASP